MDTSDAIAIMALVFTVGSFWWMHVRQGHLVLSEPHSYGLVLINTSLLFLRLPFVFYNNGPKPIVVKDLRLAFVGQNDHLPLPWRKTTPQLSASNDGASEEPSGFPVGGRQAVQAFIEFGGPWPGFLLEEGTHSVRVEAVLAHKRGWREIETFFLHVPSLLDPTAFHVYSNTPPTKAQQAALKVKAEKLLEILANTDSSGAGKEQSSDKERE